MGKITHLKERIMMMEVILKDDTRIKKRIKRQWIIFGGKDHKPSHFYYEDMDSVRGEGHKIPFEQILSYIVYEDYIKHPVIISS